MPKQIGTADAERIAMTTDEKLERFRPDAVDDRG